MAIPSYASSLITAVSRAQSGLSAPKFVMGGRNASTYKLFKKSTAYAFNIWRSKPFLIQRPFDIKAIKFSLTEPIGANQVITPAIGFDNGSTVVEGSIINSTNFDNDEKFIALTPDMFGFDCHGNNDFYFELRFSGSALVGVTLPIIIDAFIED